MAGRKRVGSLIQIGKETPERLKKDSQRKANTRLNRRVGKGEKTRERDKRRRNSVERLSDVDDSEWLAVRRKGLEMVRRAKGKRKEARIEDRYRKWLRILYN